MEISLVLILAKLPLIDAKERSIQYGVLKVSPLIIELIENGTGPPLAPTVYPRKGAAPVPVIAAPLDGAEPVP